jgi:hypothetical protein
MEKKFSDKLEKILLEGEEVLWTGKPNNEFFTSDCNTVIGSIVFSLFGMFLEILLIGSAIEYMNTYGFINIGYWIMFFLILIYIFYSLYKVLLVTKIRKNIWENTRYFITNKRILVIKVEEYEEIIKKDIDELNNISISAMSKNIEGAGTIMFGKINLKPPHVKDGKRGRVQRDSHGDGIPVFNNITDVNKVYKIVTDLKNGI